MHWEARARAIDDEYADVDRRAAFALPAGVTYLDGNSLGAMPDAARAAIEHATSLEWGVDLIRAWNSADWLHLPQRTGDRIASLIGAAPGTVVACDSTSINLYKVMHAALRLRAERTKVLTDVDNFPTDLYIVDGVCAERRREVRAVTRDRMLAELDSSVAVLTLTHVDYRTSEMADMRALTEAAHAVGALVVWDLAHSAGAVALDVEGLDVDFAVGCGYKFLNGGPGAPAFVYVAPRHISEAPQPMEGWMGHAEPFAFSRDYVPAPDVGQFLVGTPPVLALSALHGSLSVFDGIDMRRLHGKSLAMADLFHEYAEAALVTRGFTIYSHRDAASRGSHVALAHPDGYAIVQALIARGVIGDFRRPNVLRFGFAPLYNGARDVLTLVEALIHIIDARAFDTGLGEAAVV